MRRPSTSRRSTIVPWESCRWPSQFFWADYPPFCAAGTFSKPPPFGGPGARRRWRAAVPGAMSSATAVIKVQNKRTLRKTYRMGPIGMPRIEPSCFLRRRARDAAPLLLCFSYFSFLFTISIITSTRQGRKPRNALPTPTWRRLQGRDLAVAY